MINPAEPSPTIEAWSSELDSVGRVEIRSNFRGLIFRVGIAVIVLGMLIYSMYMEGTLGTSGLVVAVVAAAALVIGCVLFVISKWGGKAIVVERVSLVTMEGHRIPWKDIDHVTVFHVPRSGAAVQVVLTEQAWNAFLATQGRSDKFTHRTNKWMSTNRGLLMPQYMDARPQELAAWLNQFSQGNPDN